MSEEAKRIGSQVPTTAVIREYEDSKVDEALAIYDGVNRTALPWQRTLLTHILAVNDDGLWTHMKFGYSVPRRNGKSEILVMRALYGLTHGERVLYSAHRASTSHNAFEKIIERLCKCGYEEKEDFTVIRLYGREVITWGTDKNALEGVGCISFRTRSAKSGLGENFDTLLIDEAQEYTNDQESALKYVVTDSKNPQTLMCGTPPTAVSSGTVFMQFRKSVLTGTEDSDDGWASWEVKSLSDTKDVDLWYETNPSLGTILTERTIKSELGGDNIDDNIQRLGLWLSYNQKSVISKNEWNSYCLSEKPVLPDDYKLFYGVKYSKSGNTCLSLAVRIDNRVFVECVDCRPTRNGNAWMIPYLRSSHAKEIIIDGAGDQHILKSALLEADVDATIILPTVANVIESNALFENKLFSDEICHMGQPSVVQAVSNCEHRNIGSAGGFGYCALVEGIEMGILESISLAHWACCNYNEELEHQYIGY